MSQCPFVGVDLNQLVVTSYTSDEIFVCLFVCLGHSCLWWLSTCGLMCCFVFWFALFSIVYMWLPYACNGNTEMCASSTRDYFDFVLRYAVWRVPTAYMAIEATAAALTQCADTKCVVSSYNKYVIRMLTIGSGKYRYTTWLFITWWMLTD